MERTIEDQWRSQEPYAVLVVEDEPDHAALIQAAFSYRFFPCQVHVTESSEEAMRYLAGEWPFDSRHRYPLPDLVILDVGLPGLDGLGFLEWLRERPEPWASVPVVLFTAAASPEVEARARELGARECLTKPADFGDLVETVEGVVRRWCEAAG